MKPPERICVIAEGQLGDLLLLSPALRALKESFPHAFLAVLVVQRRAYERSPGSAHTVLRENPQGGTSAVLRADPHVDSVTEVDREALRALRGARRLGAELSVVRWLRRGAFDAVVCTFPQDRFFLWAYLSGGRLRIGEGGRPLSRFLSMRVERSKHEGGVLEYYCAMAEAAGAIVRSRHTSVAIGKEDRERADARWRSLGLGENSAVVAVHPGASGLYRVWPPDSYARLIDHVQANGFPVLLLGSEFDRALVEEVAGKCASAPRTALTTGVLDLAALLAKCALCVSNNSGPRHLAVAAGVRSLALIPRFDDAEWKIYADETESGTMQSGEMCPACPPSSCRNTVQPGERYGSYCMRALAVDAVAARVDFLLRAPRHTG